MNLAQIDFQQLRIKHILYKSKVRSVLYGGTYDAAFFSAQGPVGTWFSAVGVPRYNHEPDLKELIRLHQHFDAASRKLFTLYQNGHIEQAHDGLKEIQDMSERFLGLLGRLEEKLGNSLP